MKITGTHFRVTRRVLLKAGYTQVPSHSMSKIQYIEEWIKPIYKEKPFPRFHIIKKYAKEYNLHLDKYAKHGKDFELIKNSSTFHQGEIVEAESLKIFSACIKLSEEFRPDKIERNKMFKIMFSAKYEKFIQKYKNNDKRNTNS